MRDFTWKCCDQRTGAQLATVVGGGAVGEQRSKSSLAGPAGGIKNGSCPVADLFKACADVQIPPTTTNTTHPPTHTHSNTPSPRTLSWPLNQNKALRWHFLSQELSPALWIGISAISSSLHYIFLSLPQSLCLASGSWEGSLLVSAVLWHRARSDFWMTLAWKRACHSQHSAALWFLRVFK